MAKRPTRDELVQIIIDLYGELFQLRNTMAYWADPLIDAHNRRYMRQNMPSKKK